MLIGGATLVTAGCEQSVRTANLPRTAWPSGTYRPSPQDEGYVPTGTDPQGSGSPSDPIERSAWTQGGQGSNINRMGGVNRITVHHEGFPDPVQITGVQETAAHLEKVRLSHRRRGWADIGYHYIIDRAGRIWEGRPVQYQGAHVSRNNEHNVGVMVLGNFDIQHPTSAQLESVGEMVSYLRRMYAVSQSAVYTHRELRPTRCPGKHLQAGVERMRSHGKFA